jgi:2-dehydro-3-deoxy-D-gluconate 5-dehydrogenase
MHPLFDLQGKVAIVTGGNGGIGKAIADGLASAGADIAIAARNEAKTAQAAKDIREKFGRRVLEVRVDVKQEEEIRSLVRKVREHFERIDILVNNAGTNIRKTPQDLSAAEWDEILTVNLRSAFLCSQAVYPVMKSQGGGKIIVIGSMTTWFGGSYQSAYGASKGGIVQLARSLAVAWATDHIHVNAILPGWNNTELVRKAMGEIPGLKERIISRTPLGRLAEPEELAGMAILLASKASNFITGAAFPVDGGYSATLL